MSFPHYLQADILDCGPTCLKIIAKHYGRTFSIQKLKDLSYTNREGSTFSGLVSAAEKMGFRTKAVRVNYNTAIEKELYPGIYHWNQNHFVVVYKATKDKVYVSDPAIGRVKYSRKEFISHWINKKADETTNEGIILLLEPSGEFYKQPDDDKTEKTGFRFLLRYLFMYKKFIVQIMVGLLAGSLLSLVFPFFMQSIVDIGIQQRDVSFIYLVLLAQLFLFLGRTAMEIIRSWIMLYMSSRVNISLVADFFIKLMKLPISYFDKKVSGDILQRISDNKRIESFITGDFISIIFSMFNLVMFGVILALYNLKIFGVFMAGSIVYFLWIWFFLKRRAVLDYKRFQISSENQSKVIELINGMQEIKLHNAERKKRWAWENIQARVFGISVKSLRLRQMQSVGSSFINELKNIAIIFLSAKLVIDDPTFTLGMMLAVSYIIGQMNGPISQLVSFILSLQDARLSLDRLSEIHNREDEDVNEESTIKILKSDMSFHVNNLVFQYSGPESKKVLDGLTLTIPANKITAIVGSSGSGKTTFMKMLLKFYEPASGELMIENLPLKNVDNKTWRNQCGVVMQEGFIFNDTVAANIAVSEDTIDREKLMQAAEIANIRSFVEQLPLGFNTKIGQEGVGLSTGQKQRILIARAVYKNPDYIFFDEATSSLDAENEKVIMQNLNKWFHKKTVIIIAHRLSTVKNADQILVMENGKIVESGNHQELVNEQGFYFQLVKNQLELEKLSTIKTN